MIKNIITSMVAALFFVQMGWAQESLSLAQAIEIGLANSYQVKIAERNLEIARNSNDWAIAGRYPRINLNLNWNNSYNNNNNPASFFPQIESLSSGVVPGAEITWTLYDGSRVRVSKQQLEEIQNLSEGNIQIEVENTIQRIILAYYQALVQQEQLRVRQEVLDLSRDRLEYSRVRVEFGQAASFDVLQSQDAYINDSTSYLIQENTYQNALRDLNLAMGMDDMSLRFELTDQLQFIAEDYEVENLRAQMLSQNNTLQNLFINREIAQLDTRLAEAANYPTVNLRGTTTDNINYNIFSTATSAAGDERDFGGVRTNAFNTFVGVTATYNLLDWGVRKRNIQNAKFRELNAQLQIEDQKRTLTTQMENTLATYNNQKQLVQVTNQLVENAQRSLSIAGDRFEAGLINVFDYRNVQLSYINAQQSRLNAIFNLKTTETELQRLVGGLVR